MDHSASHGSDSHGALCAARFAATSLSYDGRRSPVVARRGMVASSQPLATQAGLQILQQGGTSADAAIATAAALAVTEPGSTGLGGDAFALHWDAPTGAVAALNGSGRAPAALSLESLAARGFTADTPWDPFHALTVTVPGAAAAWCDLHARYGRLPLADVLRPAIELARDGFPVAPLNAWFWQRGAERQLAQALGGGALTIDGRGPRAGEIFRNAAMGDVLESLAAEGADLFRTGWVADRIAEVVGQADGLLAAADLASHASEWVAPIAADWNGLRLWECPPNGQGMVALLALAVLSRIHHGGMAAPVDGDGRWEHCIVEALRLAFAAGSEVIGEPGTSSDASPVAGGAPLTAFPDGPGLPAWVDGWAEDAARRINPDGPRIENLPPVRATSSDTVYLATADGEGNATSFINSNYMGFGTGIVPRGCGFSLQNRGHNFSLAANHPNTARGGARPYHTIMPGLLTTPNGTLIGPFGVMGGFMQPQGHLQVVINLAGGDGVQKALDRPRLYVEPSNDRGEVRVEAGDEARAGALARRGHPVTIATGYERALFGRGQVIARDAATGVLVGASDPRADGQAAGW